MAFGRLLSSGALCGIAASVGMQRSHLLQEFEEDSARNVTKEKYFKTLEKILATKQLSSSCAPLKYVMSNALVPNTDGKLNGLALEFGVFKGTTINQIAGVYPTSHVHGFDSFEGLPQKWVMRHTANGDDGYEAGIFAPSKRCGTPEETWHDLCFKNGMPPVQKNVQLHKGWFDASLPAFLAGVRADVPVALLHVDSDLYSSASTVFHGLKTRIVPGTIIVFDELIGYEAWHEGEALAFYEFLMDAPHLRAEVLGRRGDDTAPCFTDVAAGEDWKKCTKFCQCDSTRQSVAVRILKSSKGLPMLSEGPTVLDKC